MTTNEERAPSVSRTLTGEVTEILDRACADGLLVPVSAMPIHRKAARESLAAYLRDAYEQGRTDQYNDLANEGMNW